VDKKRGGRGRDARNGANLQKRGSRPNEKGATEQDPLFALGMVKRAGTLTGVSKRAVKSRNAERPF